VWFDYANSGQPIVIRNNLIQFNGPKDSGIFFEVSKNGLIYNNVIANNARRGIYLSASDNTRVFNNTVANTAGYAGIELGGMPRPGATLTNNQVVNNIISHGTTTHDFVLFKPNGTTISGNTSNYNNFYRPSGAINLWYGSIYSNLSAWRTATGQDRSSHNVNPGFALASNSPPAAANMKLNAGSPLINKGQSLGGVVTRDYWATPRPQGGAYDIGGHEYR
jgi:parallel beta-helix repeat protein